MKNINKQVSPYQQNINFGFGENKNQVKENLILPPKK